jgi:hypothetical protein
LVLLGDLKLIFGLPCLLPMLEVVHTLIKFAQCRYVFIVEFMDVIKFANVELFKLYTDPHSRFEDITFDVFKSLINHLNEQLPLGWWSDLAHLIDILKMRIGDKTYGAHSDY